MDDTTPKTTNWLGFILIAVFIIFVLGLIGYLFLNRNSTNKTVNNTTISKTSTASVSITKTGFSPAEINITKGTAVIWTNNDSFAHQVAADPHPLHNSITGFTLSPVLNAGDSTSFIFDKTGTFGIHDEKNPLNKSFQMKVIVK